jgi:hypothetical protein
VPTGYEQYYPIFHFLITLGVVTLVETEDGLTKIDNYLFAMWHRWQHSSKWLYKTAHQYHHVPLRRLCALTYHQQTILDLMGQSLSVAIIMYVFQVHPMLLAFFYGDGQHRWCVVSLRVRV